MTFIAGIKSIQKIHKVNWVPFYVLRKFVEKRMPKLSKISNPQLQSCPPYLDPNVQDQFADVKILSGDGNSHILVNKIIFGAISAPGIRAAIFADENKFEDIYISSPFNLDQLNALQSFLWTGCLPLDPDPTTEDMLLSLIHI